MKKVLMFLKKYWITMLIVVACALWYAYATNHQMLDTFVFSTPEDIGKSFSKFRGTMVKNMFASFQLLFPSLFLGVVIALAFGILMGLNKRIREIFQPIVYAISVIPAILLSPIALHVAPNFRMASVFLIVYNTVWPTLFATITGIMTVDKRLIDLIIRRGAHENTQYHIKETYKLKQYIDEQLGFNLYDLFPSIKDNL